MVTLLIDTALQKESVAVLNGEKIISKIEWEANRDETKKLLVNIVKVLKRARIGFGQVDRIQAARGPGQFSGLRIGITIANVLAFALGITEKNTAPIYSKPPNITKPKK